MVKPVTGLEVLVFAVPDHVSPFPETVHDTASATDHEICVVPPDATSRGDAVIVPDGAVYKQTAEPGEQKLGSVQVSMVETAHAASVY